MRQSPTPQPDSPLYLTNEEAEQLLLQCSQGLPVPYPIFSSEQSELLHPTADGAVFFVDVSTQLRRQKSWWLNRGRQKSANSSFRKRYRTHKLDPHLKKRIFDLGKRSNFQLHQVLVDTGDQDQEEAKLPSSSSTSGSPYSQVKSWPMTKPSFAFTSLNSLHEASAAAAPTTTTTTTDLPNSSSSTSPAPSTSANTPTITSTPFPTFTHTCASAPVTPTSSTSGRVFFPPLAPSAHDTSTDPQDCVMADTVLGQPAAFETDAMEGLMTDSTLSLLNSTVPDLEWADSLFLGPGDWQDWRLTYPE